MGEMANILYNMITSKSFSLHNFFYIFYKRERERERGSERERERESERSKERKR